MILAFIYSMLWMVFLLCFCSADKFTIYNNARFLPIDIHFLVSNQSSVRSQTECVCQCYDNDMCLTAIYSDINRTCTFFSARLDQGKLQLMVTSSMMSVLTFKNKTLPDATILTSGNETVYGIWNTYAGGNSNAASSGYSVGDYIPGFGPGTVLDGNILTYYAAYGACSTLSIGRTTCGQNTGLYLSLFQGPSLLVGFQFYASIIASNLLTVTIEGSNAAATVLTLGSSWTLLYTGSSGLGALTILGQPGTMQWLSNNSIWYSSYRILVTSTVGIGNTVDYSELELYGYS